MGLRKTQRLRHLRAKPYTPRASWGRGLDTGLPPIRDGIYTYELTVSNFDATYVSISAYDAKGIENERSAEKIFLLPDE